MPLVLAHAYILMYEFKPFISEVMFWFCWGRIFNPTHYNWIPYLMSPTNCQIDDISVSFVSLSPPPAPFNTWSHFSWQVSEGWLYSGSNYISFPQGKLYKTMILNLWFLWKSFLKVRHKTEIICCLNVTCWLVAENNALRRGWFLLEEKRWRLSFSSAIK